MSSIIALNFSERHFKEILKAIREKFNVDFDETEWPHITLLYTDATKNEIEKNMELFKLLGKKHKCTFHPIEFDAFVGSRTDKAYLVLTFKADNFKPLQKELEKVIPTLTLSETPHMSVISTPKNQIDKLKAVADQLNRDRKLFYPETASNITVWGEQGVTQIKTLARTTY